MKFAKRFLLLLSLSPLFMGCPAGPTDNPAIITVATVPSGVTTASPGNTVSFKITVSSDNDLQSLSVKESINGASSASLLDSTFSKSTGTAASLTWDYKVSVSALDGEKHEYTFLLTDDKGNTAEAKQTITISSSSSVSSYSNVTLGADQNSNGSFFNTTSGLVYTVTPAKANQTLVDFVYYYGTTNLATLSCPSETGANAFTSLQLDQWTPANKNSTNYIKVTGVDFATTSTGAAIQTAYTSASGTADLKANMLAKDDVIAFKTKGGKYGLVKVNAITPDRTGTINLDVKVQK